MSSSNNNTIYKKTSFLAGNNSEFINEFYADYISDPNSLPESWRKFFEGLSDDERLIYEDLKGPSWSPEKNIKKPKIKINENEITKENLTDLNSKSVKQASKDSVRAIMLIRAYRIRGHLIANLDPLSIQKKEEHPELKPESYGFTKKDYERNIFLDGVLGIQYANLNQILKILKKTYCSNIGYEFMHMGDPEEKAWIRDRIEGPEKNITFTENGKKAILNKMIQAEGFEKYLHVKFVGTKRFGLDGGESLIPALEQIIKRGGNLGAKEIALLMDDIPDDFHDKYKNNNEGKYHALLANTIHHELGKNKLRENNVLVLRFNKYGILDYKKFLNKQDINKIEFSNKITDNSFTKKSFVQSFLQSVRQKMYSNKRGTQF